MIYKENDRRRYSTKKQLKWDGFMWYILWLFSVKYTGKKGIIYRVQRGRHSLFERERKIVSLSGLSIKPASEIRGDMLEPVKKWTLAKLHLIVAKPRTDFAERERGYLFHLFYFSPSFYFVPPSTLTAAVYFRLYFYTDEDRYIFPRGYRQFVQSAIK